MIIIYIASAATIYAIIGALSGYLYNEIRVGNKTGHKPEDDYLMYVFLGVIAAPLFALYALAELVFGKIEVRIKE